MYSKAILRRPGKNLHKGITTANLGKPDFKKALRQHEEYCNALLKCGLEIIVLEADEKYPDGCFVEDTAIITEKIAIITRLGDKSRHGEEVEISKILSSHRKIIESINLPGNVDGGDVLRVENHFYIGISRRTNKEGSRQLKEIFLKYGYSMSELQVESVLHLKTGITYLGKNNFISNYQFSKKINSPNIIVVDEDENYSANNLLINDFLLIPKGFIKSKQKILKFGFNIIEIDLSEFRKMDGGMTCLSLLF
jgi:dimethylargininase